MIALLKMKCMKVNHHKVLTLSCQKVAKRRTEKKPTIQRNRTTVHCHHCPMPKKKKRKKQTKRENRINSSK